MPVYTPVFDVPINLSANIIVVDIVEVNIEDTIKFRVFICAVEIVFVNKPSTFDIVELLIVLANRLPVDILNDDIELNEDIYPKVPKPIIDDWSSGVSINPWVVEIS